MVNRLYLLLFVVMVHAPSHAADRFLCATLADPHPVLQQPPAVAAKVTQGQTVETRNAVLIFATFKGEIPAGGQVPDWAGEIFDPDREGSFTHFYNEMSFGRHVVNGEIVPRWYESDHEREYYLADNPSEPGRFGAFSLEILRKVDEDIDFARFDNDGPDGVPNSGDDDGIADVVFIAMPRSVDNFLIGSATGVGQLGAGDDYPLDGELATDDAGVAGSPISVHYKQGTIQAGATYSVLVGTLAHEYGHVLGLPDLFDTQFLQSEEPLGPERDSAGIGNWGLMGWGADGWNGDDGPNSLSAWSRMTLGWAHVSEQSQASQTIRMEPVATTAAVHRVAVTGIEFFLMEHRTRHSYYDRNIPSEGLLIWHVFPEIVVSSRFTGHRMVVDLECADGRWMEAGYPLGSDPSPDDGGDNLDFWAHDDAYRAAHGGNLGDATDPFDGQRYDAFAPHTNPASFDALGNRSIEVSDIQIDEEQFALTVKATPLILSITDLRLRDENGDDVIMAGEPVEVRFQLRNDGGIVARGVMVAVSSPDSLVDVMRRETDPVDLEIDQTTTTHTPDGGRLAVRLRDTFIGSHTASLSVEIYHGEELVGVEELTLTGTSARQLIKEMTLVDDMSNGDGLAQIGEIVRFDIVIETPEPEALGEMSLTLHPLHPDVVVLGSTSLAFQGDGFPASARSAEFLMGSALEPGDIVGFELIVDNGFAVWRDTAYVEVAEGGDETAPRVPGLRSERDREGLILSMPEEDILDGSQITSVTAVAYSYRDTVEVARIPLHLVENRYDGVWSDIAMGLYVVRAEVEDGHGNLGVGPYHVLNLQAALQIERSGDGLAFSIATENLLEASRIRSITAVVYDHQDTTEIARVPLSLSAGRYEGRWSADEVGLVAVRVEVEDDSGNFDVGVFQPLNLHEAVPGQSIQGVSAWQLMGTPGDGWVSENSNVAFAPSSPGVVYAATRTALWRSLDGGSSWSPTGLMLDGRSRPWTAGGFQRVVLVDAVDPFTVYNAVELLRSTDGGLTWESFSIPGSGADVALLTADPVRRGRLYARNDLKLWISDDFGHSWRDSGLRDEWGIFPSESVLVHPLEPHWIYALAEEGLLYRSSDGGVTWDASGVEPLVRFSSIVPDSRCPTCLIATGALPRQDLYLWESTDSGDSWVRKGTELEFPFIRAPRAKPSLLYGFYLFAYIHRSEDAGASWERTVEYFEEGLLSDFAIDPHNPDHAVAGKWWDSPSSIVQSLDGTRTWTEGALEHGAGSPVRALDFDTDGRLYAGVPGSPAILYMSSDGGVTWESQSHRKPLSSFGNPTTPTMSLAVDPHVRGTALLISAVGDLRRTEDDGQTWTSSSAEFEPTITAHPKQSGVFYSARSGHILRSEDHGKTWERRPLPEDGRVDGLALATGAEETLFAAMGNRIYRSVNEGSSWTLAAQVGESDLRHLSAQPGSGRLWAVAPEGIYSSSDRGEGWRRVHVADRNWLFGEINARRFSEKRYSSPIRIRFDPHDSNRVFVGTPRQLLETRDGGKTWGSIGQEIAGHPWFSDVAVSPIDPEALFVATSWGVYRLDGRETAVSQEPVAVPREFSLDQNYPNPFNSGTALTFSTPVPGQASLAIYNLTGQKVRTLIASNLAAGSHAIRWDARDDAGNAVASGVYLYRLEAEGLVATKKLMLLK